MIELPFPPSINRYWRTFRGRVLVSKEGREYRQLVLKLALINHWPKFGEQRVKVTIDAFPPDRRIRDLDNLLKVSCDSLEAAGVFENDHQIDDLHIRRGPVKKGGLLQIEIESLEAVV